MEELNQEVLFDLWVMSLKLHCGGPILHMHVVTYCVIYHLCIVVHCP